MGAKMTAKGMKSAAASCVAVILSGMAMAAPVEAAVIASHDYNLFSHPDGNQAPPIYGLRLDGIERFMTGGGRASDVWTFAFTEVTARLEVHDDPALNSFRITGVGEGGRDSGGGSYVASAPVSFDFTYQGFAAAADFDPLNPGIQIFGDGAGASSKGTGQLSFLDSVLGIDAGMQVGLIAWGDQSGRLFSFLSNNHRLDCPQSVHCGFPVGWGWLGLTDGAQRVSHVSSQDFLFASRYVTDVPVPASALFYMAGLFGLGMIVRRKR